jgi:Family of unknown function (DUF6505)
MKLLRTIRLDPSDAFIFPAAAEPGEWAVPGAFVFFGADLAALVGKERSAFRSGFLGVDSLAWSTLVQIVDATPDDRAAAIELLAQRLLDRLGAPDRVAARKAAGEEIDFAVSLCNHPADTLIAMHRINEDGAIRETFRTLGPRRGPKPVRAFSFHETEDEDKADETIDLATLASGDPSRGDPR